MKIDSINKHILFKNNSPNMLSVISQNHNSVIDNSTSSRASVSQLRNAYIGYNLIDKYMGYRKVEEFNLPFIDNKAVLYQAINGDKYIILQKAGVCSVSAGINIPNTTNEFPVNHLLEHLVFSNNDYIKELNNLNINFEANCDKHNANFVFYGNLSQDDFKKLIQIQSKMFGNRHFTQEEIDKEKKLLLIENLTHPYETEKNNMIQNILSNIIDNTQNSQVEKLNYEQMIHKLTLNDVEDFYNKYYFNQAKTTVIVSPFSPDEVMNEVAKHIDKKQIKTQNADKILADTSISKTKEINITHNKDYSNVSVSFLIPNTSKPESCLITNFLANYINDTKYLKEKNNKFHKFLAGTAKINNNSNNPDILTILYSCEPGKEEEIKKEILSVISDLPNNQNMQQEFENHKLSEKDTLSIIAENNTPIARYLLQNNFFSNDTLSKCNSLNINDVKDFINKYLNVNKAIIITNKGTSKKEVSFNGNYAHETLVYPNNLLLSLRTDDKDKRASYGVELQTESNINKSAVLSKLLMKMMGKEIQKDGLNIKCIANLQALYVCTDCIAERGIEGIKKTNDLLYRFEITPEKFEKAKQELISKCELYKILIPNQKYKELIFGINPNFQTYDNELNDLRNITIDDVKNFYNGFLHNSQAISSLNMNKKTFEDNKINIFNLIGNNNVNFRPYNAINWGEKFKVLPLKKNHIIFNKSNKRTSLIQRAYRFPVSENLDDIVSFYAVNKLLKRKIFKRIRTDLQLAYKVGCNNLSEVSCNNINAIEIFAETEQNNHGNLQNVYTNILNAIEEFKENPGTQAELDKIKQDLKLKYSPDIASRLKMQNGLLQLQSPYKQNYFQAFENAVNNLDITKIKNAANYIFNANSITQIYSTYDAFDKIRPLINGEIHENK